MSAAAVTGDRHQVTLVAPDATTITFAAASGRSVVKSAHHAGYELTTGCLQGRCAICRARLLSGTVAAVRRPSPNAVGDAAHRVDGCVLLCSVGPSSDVVLAPLSPWRGPRSGVG